MDTSLFLCFWTRTGEWEFVVHARHTDKGERHVHVRRVRKRKGEYSWNITGERHDKHKFPANEKDIGRAKEIAGQRLKVDPNIFTFVTSFSAAEHVHVYSPQYPAHIHTLLDFPSEWFLLAGDDWAIIMTLPQQPPST